MNWKHLFHRCFIKLKRDRFQKKFGKIDKTSSFGENGYGDTCTIEGHSGIIIGKECRFGRQCEIIVYNEEAPSKVRLQIGDDVRATSRCRITCAECITIGNHVLLAPDVFITDHNHGMDPTLECGYARQELITKPVQICDGAWIGQRASVLPGVTIGEHSIIGANSVVTHDIPAYSIAAGSPARVFKRWNFKSNRWERVDNESTE
ncbi:MAG: acyltransferase [Clostridia bacterium]|nr:acyltransferase [Clostridia bacterium]